MSQHFPILQVVVPLLAAPLCLFVRNGRAAWGLAVIASWSRESRGPAGQVTSAGDLICLGTGSPRSASSTE